MKNFKHRSLCDYQLQCEREAPTMQSSRFKKKRN